jgi:Ala-tRNA(Pro) deacylase
MITEVIEQLERQGVTYQLLPHDRTQTARAEAKAVGIAPSDVAKTVILTTEAGYVRAVVPASERLDLTKARELLDDPHSRLATEEELGAAYPAFELGAVPPFGGPAGDRVVVDRMLAELDEVVLEAGSHDQSVKMRTSDLLTLSGAEVAEICAGKS